MDWREKYKNKIVSPEEAVKSIKSGDVIVVGQINGISSIINEALCTRFDELKDVKIFSSLGYKNEPYLDEKYRGHFTHYAWFLYPNARASYLTGMTQHIPLFFHQYPRYFREVIKPTVAVVMVSEPDENGVCSYSMNADFIYEAAQLSEKVILHVNPAMPRTGGVAISLDDATYIVDQREDVIELVMGRGGDAEKKIAENIEPYIEDGATLQLGIGGIPDFILSMLDNKKDLGIHTEVLGDGVVDLFSKGIITNAKKNIDTGKIVTACLFGGKKLVDFADKNKSLLVLPVDYTNDPYVIAKNDKVIAINSCVQVDLLGQVCSDTINGKPYSGVGGQVDFIRGARMSKGGRSFLCMPSTAVKGTVSRIVFQLDGSSPVTTSRFDVDSVVTEYGIAELWGKTMKERALALIDIAHPNFRDELERQAFNAGLLK